MKRTIWLWASLFACGPTSTPIESPAAVAADAGAALEAACPTTDVPGWSVERGEATGADAGEAIPRSRQAAAEGLMQRACVGWSDLRCAALERHLEPWKDGYFNPQTRYGCASVAVRKEDLDSLERDTAVLESHLRELAAAINTATAGAPIELEIPRWASGCSAGAVGDAVRTALQNQLASYPNVKLIVDGDPAPKGTVRLTTELTPGTTSVALTAWVRTAADATAKPLPGFEFPLDVFDIPTNELGACRTDADLGLVHGERLGAGGLRVRIDSPGLGADACEGTSIEPVVRVNRPSRVQVYSVAKGGRALLVWPPPDVDDHVTTELPLGRLDLVAMPTEGDERLVAVAIPDGAKFGPLDGLHGFCELSGGLSPDSWPEDAAVGSLTFSVTPESTQGCPAAPQAAAARAAVVLPPACR